MIETTVIMDKLQTVIGAQTVEKLLVTGQRFVTKVSIRKANEMGNSYRKYLIAKDPAKWNARNIGMHPDYYNPFGNVLETLRTISREPIDGLTDEEIRLRNRLAVSPILSSLEARSQSWDMGYNRLELNDWLDS